MSVLRKESPAPVPAPTGAGRASERLRAAGKFLYVGERKRYLRGVTYGTFRPDRNGCPYPAPGVVRQDFAAMARVGINAVRTYTVPPPWMLDEAATEGLRLMVGLPWEQHVTFLDRRSLRRSIVQRVRRGVRACAAHPAVVCFAVGNEIPAPIVRWYGRARVERFLHRLYDTAKQEDPEALVTYVNYPTTEYLQLPFLDLLCFNVFLEERERLEAYLARLQNIADDRPLVLAEVGLDSRRHGLTEQARSLRWQLRSISEAGCAGAFVFSWTDEWHRGGEEIEGWEFGVTCRDRKPKPALAELRRGFRPGRLAEAQPRPRISVAVCAYNAESTLAECLRGLARLEYPDYEVIVVDDGSTDATAAVAEPFGFRLIRTENRGLSRARNTALEAADGEIIAYIDADAYPDPEWLTYLARAFRRTGHAGIGGPNLVPPDAGPGEECVSAAPGGPVHVLLADDRAEHIPGCNMAFRTEALRAVGGFDPQFRIAGDDVDVCWRLQHRGDSLGFSPAALVWHHRRSTVRAYWKQQFNYGRAEAMLERVWPDKYNLFGHPTWAGRIYGNGDPEALRPWRWRVYYGVWGSGPFQSIYAPASGVLQSLPLMPEWYLVVAGLAGLSLLGLSWPPLVLAVPVLLLSLGAPLAMAVHGARRARFRNRRSRWGLARQRLRTAGLYLLQPLARLCGRLSYNLTPWRRRGVSGVRVARPRVVSFWSETWRSSEAWLSMLVEALRSHRVAVLAGKDYDRWDLEAWCGVFGGVRALLTVEEHGGGKQMVRLRLRPRFARAALALTGLFSALALLGGMDGAWIACTSLAVAAFACGTRTVYESAVATATVLDGVESWRRESGTAESVQPVTAARAGDC